ncbi:MAG: glycosyltransferase family 2 protein [bacterium]
MFKPVKVIDVELNRPLEDIEGLDDYNAIKALVRLHRTPIGYIRLPLLGGRCTAAALGKAILNQYAWAIISHLVNDALAIPNQSDGLRLADLVNTRHPVVDAPLPLVTVAVCTRNRTAELSICLEALRSLDYTAMDLLVIDNAPSNDATECLVRAQYPEVRYVCEPRPGLDWARNRAIAEAQGEIIAFTDDDVIVDDNWVNALSQVFAENPDVMVVTGLVVPYELETKAQSLFEGYGGFGRGFKRQWYRVDREAGELAATYYGWAGMFGIGKQIIGNNVGLSAYHVRSARAYPKERSAFIWTALWWFRKWHLKRLKKSLLHPYRFPRDLILAELRGYLIGLVRYSKSRRHAASILKRFGDLSATSKEAITQHHDDRKNVQLETSHWHQVQANNLLMSEHISK